MGAGEPAGRGQRHLRAATAAAGMPSASVAPPPMHSQSLTVGRMPVAVAVWRRRHGGRRADGRRAGSRRAGRGRGGLGGLRGLGTGSGRHRRRLALDFSMPSQAGRPRWSICFSLCSRRRPVQCPSCAMLPRAAVRALQLRPARPALPALSAARRLSAPPPLLARRAYADRPPPDSTQKPLPDLRQGIPSTFAAELARAEAAAEAQRDGNGSSDPRGPPADPPVPAVELPSSAYETSTDRRRNRFANWSYRAILLFGVVGAVYMSRSWESDEEARAHADVPNGWTPSLMYARALARVNQQKEYYTEPAFQKLLPDRDQMPEGWPPLTLVLSLEDLLLHSEWSTKHGYRVAKRPGLDYFLRYLQGQYEIVIFTSVKRMDADLILGKLDPFQLTWPLYREATRFENGEYVKVSLPSTLSACSCPGTYPC